MRDGAIIEMNHEKLCNLLGGNPFEDWPADPNLVPDSRLWHEEFKCFESFSDLDSINKYLYLSNYVDR